jgi:hypothetical protein
MAKASTTKDTKVHEGKDYPRDFSISGCANLARHGRLLALVKALGAALANQQETDAFEQVCGGIHSLGEKDICLRIVIVDADFA